LFTTKATVGSRAALVVIGAMLAAYGPVIERFQNGLRRERGGRRLRHLEHHHRWPLGSDGDR
jgi:hypothetical protein